MTTIAVAAPGGAVVVCLPLLATAVVGARPANEEAPNGPFAPVGMP